MRSSFVRFQIVKQQTDPDEKKVQIACSQAKKGEYKYFKVAIVVSDLRQIPFFSLLLLLTTLLCELNCAWSDTKFLIAHVLVFVVAKWP